MTDSIHDGCFNPGSVKGAIGMLSEYWEDNHRRISIPLTVAGLVGAVITAILGFFWAPLVDPEAWNAPEAYRILFWHVPFAWTSFLSFSLLFIGAIFWYSRRSEVGWSMVVIGSELGLHIGLRLII